MTNKSLATRKTRMDKKSRVEKAQDEVKTKKVRKKYAKLRQEYTKEPPTLDTKSTNTKKASEFSLNETVEFFFLGAPKKGNVIEVDTKQNRLLVRQEGTTYIVYMSHKDSEFCFVK